MGREKRLHWLLSGVNIALCIRKQRWARAQDVEYKADPCQETMYLDQRDKTF